MIHLLGIGRAKSESTEKIRLLPEFRKATRNMAMAQASLEDLKANLSGRNIDSHILSQSALVFGSRHGELETTKEFLRALAEQNVARPILFQNSLHNSTVGFLAMKWGITAPTLTVSNGERTAEDAFDAAWTLLQDDLDRKRLSTCIVTVADGTVPDLKGVMAVTDELNEEESATSFLLTTDASLPSLARFPAPFAFGKGSGTRNANVFEALATAIEANSAGDAGAAEFSKRDGRVSRIAWERV